MIISCTVFVFYPMDINNFLFQGRTFLFLKDIATSSAYILDWFSLMFALHLRDAIKKVD